MTQIYDLHLVSAGKLRLALEQELRETRFTAELGKILAEVLQDHVGKTVNKRIQAALEGRYNVWPGLPALAREARVIDNSTRVWYHSNPGEARFKLQFNWRWRSRDMGTYWTDDRAELGGSYIPKELTQKDADDYKVRFGHDVDRIATIETLLTSDLEAGCAEYNMLLSQTVELSTRLSGGESPPYAASQEFPLRGLRLRGV